MAIVVALTGTMKQGQYRQYRYLLLMSLETWIQKQLSSITLGSHIFDILLQSYSLERCL